jgi:hypothetical protein
MELDIKCINHQRSIPAEVVQYLGHEVKVREIIGHKPTAVTTSFVTISITD